METIERSAFAYCQNLSVLVFAKNSRLKTIGETAFVECPFNSIEIPASVETIERRAFYHCTSLQTVTFEKGSQLKAFESGSGVYGVFESCTSLTTIEIPASVETIGYYTFSDCTSLTTIEIPASVETIENGAFADCTSLKTVTFERGSKLKTVDGFSRCTSLTTIEIPASVETIENSAFYDCTSLQTVTFERGSKLKTIEENTFWGCTVLTTVDMSACTQVTGIGYYAFYDDSKLQLFKIGTRIPPSCEDIAFEGINSSSVLKVPAGCVDAYKKAAGWNQFTTISELDE